MFSIFIVIYTYIIRFEYLLFGIILIDTYTDDEKNQQWA